MHCNGEYIVELVFTFIESRDLLISYHCLSLVRNFNYYTYWAIAVNRQLVHNPPSGFLGKCQTRVGPR